MNGVPTFFVPYATPGGEEEAYEGLARFCHAAKAPPLGGRIYSITWLADGELWTATVGEKLRGIQPPRHGRRGRLVRAGGGPLSDRAEVLAIFPGDPYLVATTGGLRVTSRWSNPILAGIPKEVVRFAKAGD